MTETAKGLRNMPEDTPEVQEIANLAALAAGIDPEPTTSEASFVERKRTRQATNETTPPRKRTRAATAAESGRREIEVIFNLLIKIKKRQIN